GIAPRGEPWKPDPAVFARTVGAELVAQLLAPPLFVVCPAGDGAALLGIVSALRQRWPPVRGMTLVAAGEELPDLPRFADLPPEVERVAVTRADAGAAKAEIAARRTGAEARVERFDEATANELLRDADVLLDGTDDFETRFLANDEALRRGIPLVHGAALGWFGQLVTILPGRTACLRCL